MLLLQNIPNYMSRWLLLLSQLYSFYHDGKTMLFPILRIINKCKVWAFLLVATIGRCIFTTIAKGCVCAFVVIFHERGALNSDGKLAKPIRAPTSLVWIVCVCLEEWTIRILFTLLIPNSNIRLEFSNNIVF